METSTPSGGPLGIWAGTAKRGPALSNISRPIVENPKSLQFQEMSGEVSVSVPLLSFYQCVLLTEHEEQTIVNSIANGL